MNIVRLNTNNCLFFLCDMQITFQNLTHGMPACIGTANKMLQACSVFQIPVINTEHYIKAFKKTIPEIEAHFPPSHFHQFEKTRFSMVIPEVEALLKDTYQDRKNIILSGIEAHVCIQQTCLDLLS